LLPTALSHGAGRQHNRQLHDDGSSAVIVASGSALFRAPKRRFLAPCRVRRLSQRRHTFARRKRPVQHIGNRGEPGGGRDLERVLPLGRSIRSEYTDPLGHSSRVGYAVERTEGVLAGPPKKVPPRGLIDRRRAVGMKRTDGLKTP